MARFTSYIPNPNHPKGRDLYETFSVVGTDYHIYLTDTPPIRFASETDSVASPMFWDTFARNSCRISFEATFSSKPDATTLKQVTDILKSFNTDKYNG